MFTFQSFIFLNSFFTAYQQILCVYIMSTTLCGRSNSCGPTSFTSLLVFPYLLFKYLCKKNNTDRIYNAVLASMPLLRNVVTLKGDCNIEINFYHKVLWLIIYIIKKVWVFLYMCLVLKICFERNILLLTILGLAWRKWFLFQRWDPVEPTCTTVVQNRSPNTV